MYQNQKNQYGCPLLHQHGTLAVQNFEAIIQQLPLRQRVAFEAERAARWLEQHGWHAPSSPRASVHLGGLVWRAGQAKLYRRIAPFWRHARPAAMLVLYLHSAGAAARTPAFER